MEAIRNIGKLDSTLLSNYILERGGEMSHLKLQKILFYTQAFHLAYFNTEIIEDDFEAWVHGPVSRKIFHELKDKSLIYAELSFSLYEEIKPSISIVDRLTQDQMELVNDVIDEYKLLSGGQLESMTHSEQPWIDARKGCAPCDKCSNVILKNDMKIFYKQYLS